MYSQADIELLKRVRDLKDVDGFTLEQIAKFIRKFQPNSLETASALAVVDGSPELGFLPIEFQEAARQMMGEMVQKATEQVKGYVDDQIGKVNTNMELTLNKAVDRIDRLSEQRSRELTETLSGMLAKRQKKSLFGRFFN
jgi:DNA-binding transcriptional MerR regulator